MRGVGRRRGPRPLRLVSLAEGRPHSQPEEVVDRQRVMVVKPTRAAPFEPGHDPDHPVREARQPPAEPQHHRANEAPFARPFAIAGELQAGGDIGMLSGEQDRRVAPGHAVPRQRGEILVVALVRHCLRTIAQLHARLHETEGNLVVLMAVQFECRVEGADFTKNIARQREVTGIHVPEAELVPRLCQPVQERIHAASPIVNDRRRGGIVGDGDWADNRPARSGRVGVAMGQQEAWGGLHVVVQEDDEMPFGKTAARITRRGPTLVRLPDRAEPIGGAEAVDHLLGAIVGTIDCHDDLILRRGHRLASEGFQRPPNRGAPLVGGDHDADPDGLRHTNGHPRLIRPFPRRCVRTSPL